MKKTLLFTYGTLKRGLRLNGYLADQRFIGEAKTAPGYILLNLGWYPGLIEDPDGESIEGEVWEVDEEYLPVLDMVESEAFDRKPILLLPPFDDKIVQVYFYIGRGKDHCPKFEGTCWR